MAAPGLGLFLIRANGLKVSVVDGKEVHHPEKMLAIALSMLALGLLAYFSVSKESIRWRDRALLLAACVSFILMLPWSVFLWNAWPTLATAIQFPHRFGGILVLAVAGLFAAALDFSLRFMPRRDGIRCLAIVSSVALAVIVAGLFTWQSDGRWMYGLRSRTSYVFDETRDVDCMYPTYVSPDRLLNVERLFGTAPGSSEVVRTSQGGGNAELVQGQGSVDVLSRSPRQIVVSYLAAQASVMQMEQLYSPLWKSVLSDQKNSRSLSSSDGGLLQVSLVPGRHNMKLFFNRGWPERYGLIITVVSLVVVLGGALCELRFKGSGASKESGCLRAVE